MDEACTADPTGVEARGEFALALDARGWIDRELGDQKQADQDYRHALDLLEPLVTEFPTVPRHREVLAKVCNSLGLIEESTGRLAEAETHLRRELLQVDRLVEDFPNRPEHRRELARTLMNLGNVLNNQNRTADAELILRRSVEVNASLASKHPQDVQIRLDLAKGHTNLGELLRTKGDARGAVASFLQARTIDQSLMDEFPDQPRYHEQQAGLLGNLALAREVIDPAQVEATYLASLSIYDKLVANYPNNVNYRIGQARCLQNFGPVLANSGRPEQAEATYRKALALLDTKNAGTQSHEELRLRAGVLNNLGELLVGLQRWQEGENTLRSAMSVFEGLTARKPAASEDRHNLAIAQNNLGDLLIKLDRSAEAGPLLDSSTAQFEKLVVEGPRSIDYHSHYGIVLATRSQCWDRSGMPAAARTALVSAVEHQRQAVKLSKNQPALAQLLGEHLLELARLELKRGGHEAAARLALELPTIVPPAARPQACYDAAGILAQVAAKLGDDGKAPQDERDRQIRSYLTRTAVLLREAIDANPKLADEVKNDASFQAFRTRPEFQSILSTLVDTGK
jgi:tetratricopeptide (TPR) repeat protein